MTQNLRDFVEAVHAFDAVVKRTADQDWQNATPRDNWNAATHTWDLAQATGQPHCLSDHLAQACFDAGAPISDMLVESDRTAAPVPVAADALIVDRYLGLVGRSA